MPDPTPASPPPGPLRGGTLIALAGLGVISGAVITLAVLRALDPPILESLRPAAEVPPPADPPLAAPSAPPSASSADDVWKRTRALADTLASDEARRHLYASNAALQDEYPTPQAWGAAAAALHDRLVALPEAPRAEGGFDIRSKPGDHGSQDIVTLSAPDGGRTVLFFEGEQLVSFELP